MKKPWLAALLNFFLLGAGTLYIGKRKALGAGLTLGAIGSTYVELQLQKVQPDLYPIMFVSFFIMAVVCAMDGYQEAKGSAM